MFSLGKEKTQLNFETENPERPSAQLPPTCCLTFNYTQSDYIFIKEVFQKML